MDEATDHNKHSLIIDAALECVQCMGSARILQGVGGFPPTAYRRPRHYNSSAIVTLPLKRRIGIEKRTILNAYHPIYFFANLSTVYG